jgi:Tfp pilus assembly protein PilN
VLRAGSLAALLALVFELGSLGLVLANRATQSRIAAQAPFVEKLETAHGLATRVDELTHKRLRFFEMLAAVNEPRPRSITFTRTGTSGRNGLEIEAQTGSADDVGTYETALRNLAVLEKVEIRDLRARDGVTTFGLTVAFKADAAPGNGGAP